MHSFADAGYLPEVGDQAYIMGYDFEFTGPVLAVQPDAWQVQLRSPDGTELWFDETDLYGMFPAPPEDNDADASDSDDDAEASDPEDDGTEAEPWTESFGYHGCMPEVHQLVYVSGGMSNDEFVGPVLAVSSPESGQVQILGPDGSELWYSDLNGIYPVQEGEAGE
jgi:hypothetical protein